MSAKQSDEELNEQEAAKRRDEALKRALGTKPTPHKPSDSSSKRKVPKE